MHKSSCRRCTDEIVAEHEDNAHAYRPGRSARDALSAVQEGLWSGKVHVVDADLSRYFDTIPHSDLMRSVARRVADGKILRLIKLWLKSPVEERDRSGRWRRTGGKKSRQGIPQGGVISPLLANIYMNRFLRHWRQTGASSRLGEIVNYADDFVIVCATRAQAEKSLELVQHWMRKLGLAVNSDKTHLRDAWQESFDFLGYTFGVYWRHDQRHRILGARPSKKAQKRLKEKVDTLLYRGNPQPWPELCARLNRQLVGWANYFSFGATAGAYQAIWWHTARRVRRFLCKRYKLRARGASRFGWREVYGSEGVVDLCQYRLKRRTVHVSS
ncbi:MAG: group II intron reverse transcriptase/maturase [bacterium]|nr:group II intron reverse transcriptase/maturase [bacterium]